jgi:hypothetical protein
LKYIKNISEFQDTGIFGDSYGGGNGIFKITYKPYSDLSVTVGPDPDIPRNINGSQFQIGDIVIGVPVDEEKKLIAGMVVRVEKDIDNKGYKTYIQAAPSKDQEGEKVVRLKSNTVEFIDMGNKGHKQALSNLKFSDVPGKAFNSDTVFTASDLGIETVGG